MTEKKKVTVPKKTVKKAVAKKTEKVEKKPEIKQEEKKVNWELELPSLKELLEAGAHFGHSVKRRNPRMDQYVYAVKNGVQVFDLVKTREQLKQAGEFLAEAASQGKEILVVGTKGQAVEVVQTEATRVGIAYVVNRWVGGLFTNWDEIKKRIEKLIEVEKKLAAGEYKQYTKKEQVLIKRDLERLKRMYGGVASLTKLPEVVVIIDPTREVTALREALTTGIAVVALCDSNCDPSGVEIVVPANDDAVKTVELVVKSLVTAIEKGKKKVEGR